MDGYSWVSAEDATDSIGFIMRNKVLNLLSTNPTKLSNTLKQLVGNLPTNCLSVFDHFLGLVFKGLTKKYFVYT